MIEPLKPVLNLYKDKNKIFQNYLPEETVKKIKDHVYFDADENELYLDDNIIMVSKDNGLFYKKGKIISIEENNLTIKYNNYNISINSDLYYIFIKNKINNKNDRKFYKELLNQLS